MAEPPNLGDDFLAEDEGEEKEKELLECVFSFWGAKYFTSLSCFDSLTAWRRGEMLSDAVERDVDRFIEELERNVGGRRPPHGGS